MTPPDRGAETPAKTAALVEIAETRPFDFGGPTDRPYRPMSAAERAMTIPELLVRRAAEFPDRPALASVDDTVAYGHLATEVERLAARLWRIDPGSRDPVLCLAPQGPAHATMMLACLRLGAPCVALDPGHSALRNRQVAAQSGATRIMCRGADREAALALAPAERIVVLDERGDAGAPPPMPRPGDPAAIVYTSGSTGGPKGVVHSHASLAAMAANQVDTFHANESDVVALAAAPTSIPSLNRLLLAIGTGAGYVPIPEGAPDLTALFARLRPTLVCCFSGLWRSLARHPGAREAFRDVRAANGFGEHPTPGDLAALRSVLPAGALIRLDYSTSENSRVTGWFAPPGAETGTGRLPAGHRLPDARVWLESDATLGAETTGELLVSSSTTAMGYWRAPALTAERFVAHPTEPGVTMFRTGDIARVLADGGIEILGRRDNQVKMRGWRIELEEIEAAASSFPGVALAGVVPRRGDDGAVESVSLHFAAAPDAGATEERMIAHLRGLLPRPFWPARALRAARLPTTATGKIDRTRLGELDARARDRETEAGIVARATPPDAWPDGLSRRIAAAIAAELGGSAVAPSDVFVDLGGDSLQALNAALHIERVFGASLDPSVLLGEATIGAVIAGVAASLQAGEPAAQNDL